MKPLLPLSLLLVLTFLFGSSCLWAQRGGGTQIDVQVRNANGTAGPPGVHVRLESAEGGSAGAVDVTAPDGLVVWASGAWMGLEWACMASPINTASAIGSRKPTNTNGSESFLRMLALVGSFMTLA